MTTFPKEPSRPEQPELRLDRPEELFHEGEEGPPPGTHLMAMVRWGLIALMALVAAISLLSYFGAFEHRRSTSSSSASATEYYCPMHPSIVQDRPGQCPICSMDLVPRQKGARAKGASGTPMAGGPGTAVPELAPIELSPERIQLLGMRTALVTREALVPVLRTVGFVTANEAGLARVQTRFAGWVEEVLVPQTGASVRRGQVLANIYSPELLTTQREFLNARRWAQRAPKDTVAANSADTALEADARQRLELLGVSRPDIEEIARTGRPVRALSVRAPISGYVIAKNVAQGTYVQPETELFEIADLSTVWVLADIYEAEIGRVRLGDVARLQLTSYPGHELIGQVQFIYPTVDPESRTMKVRMQFRNQDMRLRPGMYGDVTLNLTSAEGLVVPGESVVDTGELQYVFLARQGGRFEPRRVQVGLHSGPKTQILSGVAEGDTVVTTANFLIDSESRLRAAIEGSLGAGSQNRSVAPSAGEGPCETDFDKTKYADKYRQCKECELVHRGMGTMEEDCKNAIPKPWK